MIITPYRFIPAKIAEIVRESENAVSVRVSVDAAYEFACGQYALVRVSVGDEDSCAQYIRQYSYSSPPASNEVWFTITKEPGGIVSTWFAETAKQGDKLEITTAYESPLAITPSGPLLLIAAGSGIAPLMAFVREARIEGRDQPIEIIYTTKRDKVCFMDELSNPYPHESVHMHYSDKNGRLSKKDITAYLSSGKDILVCGPREFVESVKIWCQPIENESRIHTEAFTL